MFPMMELVKYFRKLENNTDDELVDCMMIINTVRKKRNLKIAIGFEV